MLCFENTPPLENAFYRHFSPLVPAFHRQDNIYSTHSFIKPKALNAFLFTILLTYIFLSFAITNFFKIILSYCK